MPQRTSSLLRPRPDDPPYALVADLGDELARQDDPLVSMWTLVNLAQDAPGVELVRYAPDNPMSKSQALGRAWVEALGEAGMFELGRREPLVRQAVEDTLTRLLRLVAEWEVEAGTTVLKDNWAGFERPVYGMSKPVSAPASSFSSG